MIRTALVAATLLFPAAATAQQDFSNVEITSEELAPGIFVLYGAGGNMALEIGSEATFLVDDQYAPLTPKIVAKIAELGGDDVDFLVNTHWHGDHTGGNDNFGGKGAMIVAHDNVRSRLAEGLKSREIEPLDGAALPVLTFSDRQSFHINDGTVRAIHVHNAHTDGDSLVHFVDQDVLHMGDTMFAETAGTFPYIDLDSGGSIQGAVNAADMGLKIAGENTKIIPGHGKVTDRAALAAYRDMLFEVMQAVEAGMRAGQSKEAIVAAKPAAAWAAQRSGGFISEDRFIETVYDSLAKPTAHAHTDGTRHAE